MAPRIGPRRDGLLESNWTDKQNRCVGTLEIIPGDTWILPVHRFALDRPTMLRAPDPVHVLSEAL